jgi:hypothetical protein
MSPRRLQLDTHDPNLTQRQSTISLCQPAPHLSLGRASLKEASRVQRQAFRLAERQPFHPWVPPEEDVVSAKRYWQGGALNAPKLSGLFCCPGKEAACIT